MMAHAGTRKTKNFLKGKTNARYSVTEMAAIFSYLGWEIACGTLDGDQANQLGCGDRQGLNAQVAADFARKVGTIFTDSLDGKMYEESPYRDPRFSGKGHGAMFHLEVIALHQIAYRISGNEPVVGSDVGRYVVLPDTPTKLNELKGINKIITDKDLAQGKPRIRYVDVLLEGNKGEIWVEAKSYKAQRVKKPHVLLKVKHWDIASDKGTPMHKQMVFDWTATLKKLSWKPIKDGGEQVVVAENRWYFQQFKYEGATKANRKKVLSMQVGSATLKDSPRWHAATPPKNGEEPEMKALFGIGPTGSKLIDEDRVKAQAARVKPLTISRVILKMAEAELLEVLDTDELNQLIKEYQ
ncbi:hypothetical protein AHAT_17210 [Agarivorans sp. Toyoura001]|nr:hypothetical protein AHAT_17210 [Agarivorans sp. Toyoura001]